MVGCSNELRAVNFKGTPGLQSPFKTDIILNASCYLQVEGSHAAS